MTEIPNGIIFKIPIREFAYAINSVFYNIIPVKILHTARIAVNAQLQLARKRIKKKRYARKPFGPIGM